MKQSKKEKLYIVTNRILTKIENTQNDSVKKAVLANFRKSIGKPFSEMTDIWSFLFENMPEEFLGTDGNETPHEKAIVSALQIYAICSQGSNKVVYDTEEKFGNIGQSFSVLRGLTDGQSIDQRFNTMITSSSFEELTHHMRSMVKILKSKATVKIDYAKLAEDLFWYQCGFDKQIKLNWARSFYRRVDVEKKEEE
ncbi:type I-E CRISPR-associated protein Cse2/CasB [Filifactor alocis]|uniref:type I-E CRISPR-associated protein Cse2/CasB n=1 Tax=Filifactor alocis TaxID=143361 RepID=UPI003C6FF4FF